MEFILWLIDNFGVLFGGVFLIYLFFIIRRVVVLYDLLRWIPANSGPSPTAIGDGHKALAFLAPMMERLRQIKRGNENSQNAVIEAIWGELDRHVSVHFTALQGLVHTLILFGFAGTIFGAIGAFNAMFQGLARGESAATVFAASWNDGLATALYTSLGAAVIGAIVLTLVSSRYLMSRAKQLEVIVGLRISEIIEENESCHSEENEPPCHLKSPKIPEKTSLPIFSS